ncbi:hypothetical protein Tco_0696613, partial [Tanacetum coccineum]
MCKTAKEVWLTLIITHQGNSQVKNCKIDLLTQEYEKFSISNDEPIDSGFTRLNAIVTSLKSLDLDYSSKNHAIKFLHALPLKWRAKVMAIEEAKDLATLPLNELIKNLKVYEMVLDNDGVGSKTTKEKVKSLALKAKVTREQTSDDSDSQGGSYEDIDEEEAEAFNLLTRNFCKFFRKGEESSKPKGACYNCGIEGDDEHQNDATCLMAIDSQEVVSKPSSYNIDLNIIDLQKENEELLKLNKDFDKIFEKLLNEKRPLEKENSKLSSKINDLQIEVKKLANDKDVVEPCKACDVCLKCDLLPDDWIVDSGCTKHMTGNRRFFTLYKAYDGRKVVFWSNLMGKVVGGVSFTKVDCDISKDGKTLAKSHRRYGLYTCKLGDKSKQQICLASVVDNSTLWHKRLGHANCWELFIPDLVPLQRYVQFGTHILEMAELVPGISTSFYFRLKVQFNHALFNMLSNEMVLYVNVLGVGVLDIFAAESNGTAVIHGNLIEGKTIVSSVVEIAMLFCFFDDQCHSGVFRISKSPIDGSSEIPKDPFKCFKVLFGKRCLIPSTHAYNEDKVGSAGSE